MTVHATHEWADNAALIEDVARLGYLDGHVLDATFGLGNFWTRWQPEVLVTNDLNPEKGAQHQYDFRKLGWAEQEFDAVVFDPPYKLSGTPALGEFDERYGIDQVQSRNERMKMIAEGTLECWRVTDSFLLVKCQDQVEGGKVRWQTDLVTHMVMTAGGSKVDRFDFIYKPRPQPGNRQQRRARRNTSTLLVFER